MVEQHLWLAVPTMSPHEVATQPCITKSLLHVFILEFLVRLFPSKSAEIKRTGCEIRYFGRYGMLIALTKEEEREKVMETILHATEDSPIPLRNAANFTVLAVLGIFVLAILVPVAIFLLFFDKLRGIV